MISENEISVIETKIFNAFSPQIGEVAWHTFTIDPDVIETSESQFSAAKKIVKTYFSETPKVRILEMCANNHISGYMLKKEFDCDISLLDLSTNALQDGQRIATGAGYDVENVEIMVSDYHNLPFEDNTFDFIYMKAAIHHTDTPEIVFNEVMRILKTNGVFSLSLEPVKRTLCSYSFKTNRKESISTFENNLFLNGVLGFLSYPTLGSRPEDLFQMTENGEIPLSFYTDQPGLKILKKEYYFDELTDFEKILFKMRGLPKDEIADLVKDKLSKAMVSAKAVYSNKDLHMGFKLLTDNEISELAHFVGVNLARAGQVKDDKDDLVNLFGGAISIDYLKVEPRKIDENRQKKALLKSNNSLDLTKPLLPNIQDNDLEQLHKIFPVTEWDIITDAGGSISVLNKGTKSSVILPKAQAGKIGLLVVRFYGVELEDVYKVTVSSGKKQLSEISVCMSETRFFKKVDFIEDEVEFNITDIDNKPIDIPGHIRIGVFQLFDVRV